ncbi:type IX secretion system periplasmic lipoprotein PorW/SprE [Carboxylicivirga marina]|uniref:Tetratricopeptide repeat protein n=1 Tax=Carboxylicivirga marina TaxID=2800988 RepID=A0ABS1HPJ1_9BACT|nr:tetratricopeptide repeat protein [Carboxylicivirga marina]MBK3519595.1 tetratricopeptide repeat protein [Carboxylicivirga marina]
MIFRKISIILILLSLWSCSTKKNTWLSRNYHNLTAYYNVYYNGREAFRNGDKAIIDSYENDYSNILPVFESADADAASVASGDMDRAIEKGQKLIKKHSITAKPKKRSRNNAYAAEFYSQKEFNAWVDNAYVLIGKSQVYKHEQNLAIRTLQQVVRDFPNSESMYEALIWQARAYTDKGDYIGALAALESYDLGGNAPIDFYSEYMAVYANLLMVQEKYIEAIPYLSNALADEKNKHKRLRYSYILGQLYLLNNQRQEAAESFGYVAKASTDYEMTFNAKVNQASIVYANADITEVKKQLHKLRKDKKNKDYLDRIYYAFGRVALQENDETAALSNFKKSVNASVDNSNQKGLSYREAGEIYYSHMDFANAYFYYDSALTVINEDYEQIDELKERHYGLSGLIEHLLTVEREDSLQQLADISEPVLYAYLDEIIAEKEEEQKRLQKLQEEESMSDAFFYQNASTSNAFGQTGKWYFYNQNSMGMGKMEFEKRWGKRKLEDNWRRKDKSKVAEQQEAEDPFALPDDPFAEDGGSVEKPEGETTNEPEDNTTVNVPTREQLLADIPLSDSQRKESDDKIEAALLELGLVFMDRLANYPKSIEALEDLLQRYPKAESRDEALIALYNAYRLNGDNAGMLATKNRIEQEFPEHRFVAYLNDPDFVRKVQEKKEQESLAYESTYEAFLFGRFDDVISNSNSAINNSNEDSKLTNKYLLLRGLSHGKKGDAISFKSDLETIISNDKESEEAELAQVLLKHLSEGKAPVQGTLYSSAPNTGTEKAAPGTIVDTPEQKAGFVYVEKEPYELVVMSIDDTNMNRAIYNVADYNFSRYLLHDFEIQEKRLLDGSLALTVSGFTNRVEVMDYFYGLRENPQFFGFERITDNIVCLSESNSSKFYLSGLVADYIEFFNTYYLQHADKKELEKVMPKEAPLAETPENNNEQGIQEEATNTGKEAKEEEAETLIQEQEKISETQTTNESNNKIEAEKGKEVEANTTKTTTPPVKEAAIVTPPLVTPAKETETEPQVEDAKSIYVTNNDEQHKVQIIVRKTRIDYNKLQKGFAAHTRNNFGTDKKVELLEFGTTHRMVQISSFANADEAKAYIRSIDKYPYLTRDISQKEHFIWAISESNFKKLQETNELEAYNDYFKTNY